MTNQPASEDDLREEYDFTPEQFQSAVRGKYAARYAEGVNLDSRSATTESLERKAAEPLSADPKPTEADRR